MHLAEGREGPPPLRACLLPCRQLMQWVEAAAALRGRRMHSVSREVWQAELSALPPSNPMAPLVRRYGDGLPGVGAEDCGADAACRYAREEVERCVDYLERQGEFLGEALSPVLLVRTCSSSLADA